MSEFIINLLAFIGFFTLLISVILLVVVSRVQSRRRTPRSVLLTADFTKGMVEYFPYDQFSRKILGSVPEIRVVVESIRSAAKDRRVAGLAAKIGMAPMQFADIQEIRNAVEIFRQSGKPSFAFAESFGEFGPGNGSYYLATAFDTVYTQPSGDIGLTGLMSQTPFIRRTLDKLGIEPRLEARAEYKNFRNIFTEDKFTEPHKEASQTVMNSLFRQMVDDIAARRQIQKDKLMALINAAPVSASDAVQAKLIDAALYQGDIYEIARKKTTAKAVPLDLITYSRRNRITLTSQSAIALIYGVGNVTHGESKHSPRRGMYTMGSDTIIQAFDASVKDRRVKAIVFRINSPGGSYTASDAIYDAVMKARKAGKPVVATMGAVAGSGGYFAAMGADHIVAHPGTITGSIGVVGGKFLTSGLWKKTGLSFDEIHTTENAPIASSLYDYTPSQHTLLQQWLDRVYDDFVTKVAQSRNLPVERVKEIAKGRIWSGKDAQELGLVDSFGGIHEAIHIARQRAHIPEKAKIRLTVFPKKKKLFARFLTSRLQNGYMAAGDRAIEDLLKNIEPIYELIKPHQLHGSVLSLTRQESELGKI